MEEQQDPPSEDQSAGQPAEATDDLSSGAAAVVEAAAVAGGEGGKRKREAIMWTGKKDEAAGDVSKSESAEAPSGSPKRLRPSPAFLTGFVSGIKRTNQRLVADAVSNAACKEITAAAANGAKARFERISAGEPAKMRRAALHTATQQNLANCVALLKEVAVHFGYSLDIEDETGDSAAEGDANTSLAADPGSQGDASGGVGEGAGEEEEEEVTVRPLKPMSVKLRNARAEEEFLHRQRPPPAQSIPPRPKPKLPTLAKGNRLAGSAFAALGSAPPRAKKLRTRKEPLSAGIFANERTKPPVAVSEPEEESDAHPQGPSEGPSRSESLRSEGSGGAETSSEEEAGGGHILSGIHGNGVQGGGGRTATKDTRGGMRSDGLRRSGEGSAALKRLLSPESSRRTGVQTREPSHRGESSEGGDTGSDAGDVSDASSEGEELQVGGLRSHAMAVATPGEGLGGRGRLRSGEVVQGAKVAAGKRPGGSREGGSSGRGRKMGGLFGAAIGKL